MTANCDNEETSEVLNQAFITAVSIKPDMLKIKDSYYAVDAIENILVIPDEDNEENVAIYINNEHFVNISNFTEEKQEKFLNLITDCGFAVIQDDLLNE